MVILDHIKKLGVSDGELAKNSNIMRMRNVLGAGLGFLYAQVSGLEAVERAQEDPNLVTMTMLWEPRTGFPLSLLVCYFHWYSVSASSYVDLMAGLLGLPVKDYRAEVIPGLRTYRDKVGAHPVGILDDKRDNRSEKDLSVVPHLSFVNGKICANYMMLQTSASGLTTDTSNMKPWSLTEQHEELVKRYGTSPSQPLMEEVIS